MWRVALRGNAACALLACGLLACGRPELPKKVDWVQAGPGAVDTLLEGEQKRAVAQGRQVLVYVGATWCEPCRRFHEAVEKGSLDATFGTLRLVEFDFDRDGERLAVAGYAPKLIPLLALPDAHGHATGRQMEGSVKGDGAVNEMVPRLRALLAP